MSTDIADIMQGMTVAVLIENQHLIEEVDIPVITGEEADDEDMADMAEMAHYDEYLGQIIVDIQVTVRDLVEDHLVMNTTSIITMDDTEEEEEMDTMDGLMRRIDSFLVFFLSISNAICM